MAHHPILLNQILTRQFVPAFRMFRKLIEACPKALWSQKNIEPPIWQQFYHVLYGLDYWFSESKGAFVAPRFASEANSALGEASAVILDKDVLLGYLDFVENKSMTFMEQLSYEDLPAASALYTKWTNFDVVLEQLRHLQHHIGYMNRVFLKCRMQPVEWEFYEEEYS